MPRHQKGHFSSKHPPGTRVSDELSGAVAQYLLEGGISCRSAHAIANVLNVSPAMVGVAIDLAEGRILKCQLGLFGYGQGRKEVVAAKSITPILRTAINSALLEDRFLPCSSAWRIAKEQGISRIEVANACEMLAVRIKPCQLGAF